MRLYQGTFRKLIVWQSAKLLTRQIYSAGNRFPPEERFGLTSQMKRASVSVMSNIAEGNQRKSRKENLYLLNVAFGSITELDCQTELAFELGYLDKNTYNLILENLNKTAYLLFNLINSLKQESPKTSQSS